MEYNKGLIIRKEWLHKIFNEDKIWEMRSTKTQFRGKFYLIESGSSLIVGEAELVDCLDPINSISAKQYYNQHKVSDYSLLDKWKYPWVLSNVIKYDNPIFYKHPQGAVIWVNL